MSSVFIILIFVILLVAFLGFLWVGHVRQGERNAKIIMQYEEIRKQVAELRMQAEKAKDVYLEKQQLLGMISHDLKSPFNRIFALVQLMNLSSENLTPDQKDYLGKIHQIAADGMSMVRNLADNRRMDEKWMEISPEKLNISALLGSLIKNFEPLAAKKQIALHFEAPPQVSIFVDKLLIYRVLENILSNAIKFSPPQKSVWIKINEDEKKVALVIKDEGPGFTDEELSRLFLKFQQFRAKPTGGENSTGLGLSIVKSLAEKIGAEVSCNSEENKGAEFVVCLPKDQLKR